MTKDMTEGSGAKLIFGFAVPLFFGFLFQQFYNLVDTIIVGRFLGVEELACVGATGSLNFMIVGFCMGVCNGFSIPVSHKFGAGDYSGMRRYVANCAWLGIGFSLIITAVTALLCRNMLVWMKTPENILEGAHTYIFIILLGLPATFLYNIVSGIMRALGDSRTPVVFLVISSVINIGLDLVFIIYFKLGVAGAAYATVIAQVLAGVGCLLFLVRKFEILHIAGKEWKPDAHMMSVLCNMGIPMGLQYSITAIGSVILQSATNTLGAEAVAAVTAGSRVSCFLACPFDALGSTMATYGGQNVGAGKLDRIGPGLRAAVFMGAVYSVVAFLIVFFGGEWLGGLFVDGNEILIIAYVKQYLLFNTAAYFLLGLVNIIRFLIQGMGFANFAILAGVLEMIARSVAGIVLVPLMGFTGVCMGSCTAWILADAFLIPAYFIVLGKLRKRDRRL